MPNRALLAAITAIICLPLIFSFVGGGGHAGVAIGVVLVLVGIGWGLLGSRSSES
jgi:hypothetical protein